MDRRTFVAGAAGIAATARCVPSPSMVDPAVNSFNRIARRIIDWSLVTGSFALILLATVVLRPPGPVPATAAAAPAVVAAR